MNIGKYRLEIKALVNPTYVIFVVVFEPTGFSSSLIRQGLEAHPGEATRPTVSEI